MSLLDKITAAWELWRTPTFRTPRSFSFLLCRAEPLISLCIPPTGHTRSPGTLSLPESGKTFKAPTVRSPFTPGNHRIGGKFALPGTHGVNSHHPWILSNYHASCPTLQLRFSRCRTWSNTAADRTWGVRDQGEPWSNLISWIAYHFYISTQC